MTEQLLDVRGLVCPLPVLRARKALKALPAGGTLRMLATDPQAVRDVRLFCEQTGHVLLESGRESGDDGEVFSFLIERHG